MNLRQMEIVTDVDKLKVDLQATFMQYTTIKKWAYIIHDKDDTRPHYHIALHFGGASVDTAQVAKWFNLGYTDDNGTEHSGENFINKIKGRWTDVLLYLTHANDTQKYKHQYSPSEVVANFDFETEIANAKILGDFEHYSYAQQLKYEEINGKGDPDGTGVIYKNELYELKKEKSIKKLDVMGAFDKICESFDGLPF